MVQSLTPPGIIVPGGVSDHTKCLEVSDEDNKVSGVQTTNTRDIEPNKMDPGYVQMARCIVILFLSATSSLCVFILLLETQRTSGREK